MKAFLIFGKGLVFIILTTVNAEYLINRSSSSLLTITAIFLEMLLIYLFIYPFIRKLLKS